MAILNAIAAAKGSSLLNILHPQTDNEKKISGKPSNVKICALIDCNGTPVEVAYVATSLVKEGFTAIKLKVRKCLCSVKFFEAFMLVVAPINFWAQTCRIKIWHTNYLPLAGSTPGRSR